MPHPNKTKRSKRLPNGIEILKGSPGGPKQMRCQHCSSGLAVPIDAKGTVYRCTSCGAQYKLGPKMS